MSRNLRVSGERDTSSHPILRISLLTSFVLDVSFVCRGSLADNCLLVIRCMGTGMRCDGYDPQHRARNSPAQQTTLGDKAPQKPLVLSADIEKSLVAINVTR